MAEETQPTKRHKTCNIRLEHNIPQESPNGDDIDPQILIPTGEDEQKQIPLDDHESDKDGNTFNDSHTYTPTWRRTPHGITPFTFPAGNLPQRTP
jgi:hypothetical protein